MIVVAYGGCGSSFLLKSAGKIFGSKKVHRRPEVNMKPEFWHEPAPVKLNDYYGYDTEQPKTAIGLFAQRARGYKLDSNVSIETNLARYVHHVNNNGICSVMTWASYYRLFSRNKINDVVFLIRHPLHQCISWLHPKQSPDGRSFAKGNNGLFTTSGIDAFIRMWNSNIDEMLRLRALGLRPISIRFEYVNTDKYKLDLFNNDLRQCFNGFRSNSRHDGVLPSQLEQRLKDRCLWGALYDDWRLE